MLYKIFDAEAAKTLAFIGIFAGFLLTCLFLKVLKNILPRDGGRAFAVNGALSQGKPRGAGIVFIIVFSILAVLFVPFDTSNSLKEMLIYILMIDAGMLSGYLDDSAKTPWGGLKKGLIDLAIALVCAVTYVNFNSTKVTFMITGTEFVFPAWLFIILAVILIWGSINVTNCTDGVDGLSGSTAIVTTITFYILFSQKLNNNSYSIFTLIMAACLLGYLWFNASPSRLLMGDAGSRAIGLFIAIIALKTGSPFFFLPAAAVFIIDGGLGLLKLSLLKFLKIKILKNTRTPIHDHVRKNCSWSDTQTVFRFVIIQTVISITALFFVM